MIRITVPASVRPSIRLWSGTCAACRCEVECDDDDLSEWGSVSPPAIKCPNLYCRAGIEVLPLAEEVS